MPSFEDIESSINREILKKVENFSKLIKGDLNIDLENVTRDELRLIKRSIGKYIKKSGMNGIAGIIISFFDEIEHESDRLFSKSTKIDIEKLNEIAIDKAEKMINLGILDDIDKIEKDLGDTLRKGLQVRKLKDLSKNELIFYVDELMKATVSKAEAVSSTAVMSYDRAITTFKANELGLNKFKYTGADDRKTRPFCDERVGNIYTDEEAKYWNNGQKSPASIYLGGYNCRHRKVYQID